MTTDERLSRLGELRARVAGVAMHIADGWRQGMEPTPGTRAELLRLTEEYDALVREDNEEVARREAQGAGTP